MYAHICIHFIIYKYMYFLNLYLYDDVCIYNIIKLRQEYHMMSAYLSYAYANIICNCMYKSRDNKTQQLIFYIQRYIVVP